MRGREGEREWKGERKRKRKKAEREREREKEREKERERGGHLCATHHSRLSNVRGDIMQALNNGRKEIF